MTIGRRLREFAFDDQRVRWKIYRVVMGLGFAYGAINGLLLERPADEVTYEMAIFMAVLTAAALIVRSYSRRATYERCQPGINRSYLWILIVVSASTVGINSMTAEFNQFERRLTDKRIANSVLGKRLNPERAEELFRSAQTLRLQSDPQVRAIAAKTLLEAPTQERARAWSSVNALLGYQSAIVSPEDVISTVVSKAQSLGITRPAGLFLWGTTPGFMQINELNTTPWNLQGADVPGNIAAVLAPIDSQLGMHPIAGPAYIILGAHPNNRPVNDNAHFTVPIDGLRARNIIFRRCLIRYSGRPVVLDNVAFEDCIFEITDTQSSRQLVMNLIGAKTTNFVAD
jgi:hypothetical protein